jgi:putative colanic acid biosynthesis UDP-glucose lipid carrier transferase
MNTDKYSLFKNILWLCDLVALNLILVLSSFLIARANAFSKDEYRMLHLLINMSWMVSLYLTDLYTAKHWWDFRNNMMRTSKVFLLTLALVFSFIFFYHYPYSRLFIITSFGLFFSVLLLNRVIFHLTLISLRNRSFFRKNIVVLGYNNQSQRLVNYFTKEAKLIRVAGCFDDTYRDSAELGLPFTGSLRDCMPFVKKNRVSEIYSTLAPENNPYIYQLVNDAEKNFVHFKFVPDYNQYIKGNLYVEYADDMPILTFRKSPLDTSFNRLVKRLADVLISSFVIIFFLSWMLPLFALLIKLESKGSVFFVQLRSGKNNSIFSCIKLRTLKENDEANSRQVTRNDERITRIGRFLRRTSLDELPQFINIFLGDMSVVGPRPHMLKHTEEFSSLYEGYELRHYIKPGLTGWAQVNNLRGEIDPEKLRKRTQHDFWYIENWSLWLDIRIMLMTVWVSIVGSENAI